MKVSVRNWNVLAVVLISFLICNKYGCGKNPFGNDTETYRWYEVESPTEENLYSVYFVNSNDGWAVGDRGTIIHYDGSEWHNVVTPVNCNLHDVYFVSSHNGWAVGDSGTILHYDGNYWQNISSFNSKHSFTSIYFVSDNIGYICSWEGSIIFYNGAEWVLSYNRDSAGWMSLYFTSEDDGWVVGWIGIMHYTNGIWEYVDTLNSLFNSVFMLSLNLGWAVASPAKSGPNTAQTWRYNGTKWEQVENPAPVDSWGLSDIYFVDENNGWAVGHRSPGDEERPRGYIIYYNGTSWTLAESSIGDCLKSVYFLSRDEGWAVGMNGTILHYCGD